MARSTTRRPLSRTAKIAIVTTIVVVAGVTVSGAAFAVLTASGTGSVAISSGAVEMIVKAGSASAPLSFENIAPGDTIQRPITITLPRSDPMGDSADRGNIGSLVGKIVFSYTARQDTAGVDPADVDPPGSLLAGYSADTDAVRAQPKSSNGMTYRIDTCPVAWVAPVATDAAAVYTCPELSHTAEPSLLSGEPTVVIPADFGSKDVTFDTEHSDVTLFTLVTFTLPITAGNGFQNASLKLDLTTTAVQRDGIRK